MGGGAGGRESGFRMTDKEGPQSLVREGRVWGVPIKGGILTRGPGDPSREWLWVEGRAREDGYVPRRPPGEGEIVRKRVCRRVRGDNFNFKKGT